MQMVPSDVHDLKASHLQSSIAVPVILECVPSPVRFESVELDYQAGVAPEAIRLVPLISCRHPGVEARPRNIPPIEKAQKAGLQLPTRDTSR